jgi:hypothetical protein
VSWGSVDGSHWRRCGVQASALTGDIGLEVVATRALPAWKRDAKRDEGTALLERRAGLVATNEAGLVVETATGTVLLRPVTATAIRLGLHRARVQRKSADRLSQQARALHHLRERALGAEG